LRGVPCAPLGSSDEAIEEEEIDGADNEEEVEELEEVEVEVEEEKEEMEGGTYDNRLLALMKKP